MLLRKLVKESIVIRFLLALVVAHSVSALSFSFILWEWVYFNFEEWAPFSRYAYLACVLLLLWLTFGIWKPSKKQNDK